MALYFLCKTEEESRLSMNELKVVFCSNIIGGWPSAWDDASINIRKDEAEKFTPIKKEQLFY